MPELRENVLAQVAEDRERVLNALEPFPTQRTCCVPCSNLAEAHEALTRLVDLARGRVEEETHG